MLESKHNKRRIHKVKIRNAKTPSLPSDAQFALRSVNSSRRHALWLISAGLVAGLVAVPVRARAWHSTDISGALPALSFMMTRATDGKEVSATNFKGKVTLLYFGYTFCPDVCPTTLLNLTIVLKNSGRRQDDVRVLFVTVDPNRDTLDVFKQYMQALRRRLSGCVVARIRSPRWQSVIASPIQSSQRQRVTPTRSPTAPRFMPSIAMAKSDFCFRGLRRQTQTSMALPTICGLCSSNQVI